MRCSSETVSYTHLCGADIEKLVRPILDAKADIVIGERPIDDTEHFSPLKKKLQHIGSWTVRVASKIGRAHV